MTHYANDPGAVRADFYRRSGKWYMTDVIHMGPYYNETSIHNAVHKALEDFRTGIADRYIVVVQEPYHRNAFPIMLIPETLGDPE